MNTFRPAGMDKPHSHNRITVLAVCLFIFVVTLAAFGHTVNHEFVHYDDNVYVYENPRVNDGLTSRAIIWAFTSNYASNWHPLTWLSHMLDCQFYGLRPGGHHLTNVVIHVATAVLLLLVLLRMTGALWPSAFVAVVFAIHPLRVESVAWVAERKDVLSGLFFVLTIGAYARYVERRSLGWYLLVVLAFVLGLMAKPMLVTLPFVLLLLDYWPLRRYDPFAVWEQNSGVGEAKGGFLSISRLVLEKLPLFVLAAASCVATVWAQQSAIVPAESLPLSSRVANVPVAYVAYLGQMFYPVGLAVLYPHRGGTLPVVDVGGAFLLLFGISVAILMWTRQRPYLIVGWLWYLGTLVPVIGLVQVGRQAIADRYTYLSQIGLYIVIAWAVAELSSGRRYQRVACGTAAAVIIATLVVCTWRQTMHWRDSEKLLTHALSCTSRNVVAHANLGAVLSEKKEYERAIKHYKKALAIDPEFALARGNWGRALLELGKPEEAIEHCRKAAKIDPQDAAAHNDWGNALLKLGEFEEAIEHYRKAAAIDPRQAGAHGNWGNALLKLGQPEEAIEHYRKALAIDSRLAAAHYNLGNTLLKLGKPGRAIEHYRKALTIDPEFALPHNNWGNALLKLGKPEEAIKHYQKALAIDPGFALAHYNWGNALHQLGKPNHAIEHFRKALTIHPGLAAAHNQWGNVLSELGEPEQAIQHYQMAMEIDSANPEAPRNLAWVLATCPIEGVRDGARAIELAKRVCEASNYKIPTMLDTLAAAYAETGGFPEAVATVTKALDLLTPQQEFLAEELRRRRELYKADKPYRERPEVGAGARGR